MRGTKEDVTMSDSGETLHSVPDDQPCRFCGGAGKVSGAIGDIEFIFDCICSRGNEETIRWLLGSAWPAPPGDAWVI